MAMTSLGLHLGIYFLHSFVRIDLICRVLGREERLDSVLSVLGRPRDCVSRPRSSNPILEDEARGGRTREDHGGGEERLGCGSPPRSRGVVQLVPQELLHGNGGSRQGAPSSSRESRGVSGRIHLVVEWGLRTARRDRQAHRRGPEAGVSSIEPLHRRACAGLYPRSPPAAAPRVLPRRVLTFLEDSRRD